MITDTSVYNLSTACVAPPEPRIAPARYPILCEDEPLIPAYVYPTPFSDKPNDDEEMGVSFWMGEQKAPRLITGPKLEEYVQAGHVFCPAIFQPHHPIKECWIGTRLFVLDFEYGKTKKIFTLQDFMKRCYDWDIRPNLVYTSWHHLQYTDDHRFHACFLFDGLILDPRIYSLVCECFKLIFPEMDMGYLQPHMHRNGSKPDSLQRYDFDGNRLDWKPTFLEDFLWSTITGIKSQDKAHFSAQLEKFAHQVYMPVANGFFALPDSTPITDGEKGTQIWCEIVDHLTSNSAQQLLTIFHPEIMGVLEFPFALEMADSRRMMPQFPIRPAQEKKSRADTVALPKKSGRTADKPGELEPEQLASSCSLFNDFWANHCYLNHQQRVGLFTNLIQFRNGRVIATQALDEGPYSSAQHFKATNEITYFIRREYAPHACEKMDCPYLSECNRHGLCPVHQLQLHRREIRVIANPKYSMTLAETRSRLKAELYRIKCETGDGVYVIQADTGVGKTEAILEQDLHGCYVGFPTHQMAKEAYERASNKGIRDIFLWERRPTFPPEYETAISRLERLGITGSLDIMRGLAERTDEVGQKARSHLDRIAGVQRYPKAFGTHDKALLINNPNIDTFIIDEDIFGRLINVITVTDEDVQTMWSIVQRCRSQGLHEPDKLDKFCVFLDRVSRATILDPIISQDKVDSALWASLLNSPQCKSLWSSQISLLPACTAFLRSASKKSIVGVQVKALPQGKKWVILSATANEKIYRAVFGDRLTFVDLRGTVPQGKLFLHPEHSLSRTCIGRLGSADFGEYVSNQVAVYKLDGVITFKQAVDTEQMVVKGTRVPVFAWFGNLEGYDYFKEKRIGIFGVPHLPIEVYQLCSYVVSGVWTTDNGNSFVEYPCESNEFEFSLAGPQEATLRYFQKHLIESQLLQAAGRSRYITTETEVHLFGNFPISGCILP